MIPGWEKQIRNHFAAVFDYEFLPWHLEIWQLSGILPTYFLPTKLGTTR